jgi:hypothetical protein
MNGVTAELKDQLWVMEKSWGRHSKNYTYSHQRLAIQAKREDDSKIEGVETRPWTLKGPGLTTLRQSGVFGMIMQAAVRIL